MNIEAIKTSLIAIKTAFTFMFGLTLIEKRD